jgi:glucuronoarabinoxylan endo-1,4-beta-xylanase
MKKNLQNRKENSKNWIVALSFIFTVLSMIFSIGAYAQTFVIKGLVSISTTPVRYASVTFVNKSDTSSKFSALTDTSGNYQINAIITSVNPHTNVPAKFDLGQNYPNPFLGSTAISYNLKAQSDGLITIYDILGREVKRFTFDIQAAGVHGIMWDGSNSLGKKVATGIYFYRLQAGGEAQIKKMVYGLGEGGVFVSPSKMYSSQTTETIKSLNKNLQSETFTIQIANTDSTFPAITPKQMTDIVVQNDTTINITVNAYIPPNAATIYLDSTQQIIRGFGAANIVGWVTIAPDMTPAEVQTAFGMGDGQLGFTIMRLRIPPDSSQYNIDIPSAKAAESLGAIVIATPWTPPAWMKSNNNTIGGTLKTSAYDAYAAHLKAFSDTMSNNGAPLYAISVQNEPDANVNYESCFWNATQFLNFMKNNAPAVGAPIFMPESESFTHQLSDSTLNDPVAAANVAFIGGHVYGVGVIPSYPLAMSKGKEVWMTEFLINSSSTNPPNSSLDTGWTGAIQTAKSINDCMNANMSAYVWWYIVRYYGPIDDGAKGGVSGSVTKKGYVMSQYARFVRPGTYRVNATAVPQTGVNVTAYYDGVKVVIVAINNNSSAISQTFIIQNGTAITFTPYVTSSTKNCTQGNNITASGGIFTVTLDASSITTFVSN